MDAAAHGKATATTADEIMAELKPNYVMKAKVTRVLDGDTCVVDISPAFHIVLEDYKIRFYGIDTSETNSTDPEERKRAQAAKQFVTNAILNKTVLVQSVRMARSGDEKVDSFGRYLMVVFYKDAKGVQQNLNQQLLALGLAKVMVK